MKKLSIYLIALLFVSSITFTGCKDDPIEDIPDPAYTVLTDYLTANSLDLSDIKGTKGTSSFFATGAFPADDGAVAAWAAGYTILDIRSADDFDESDGDGGHIPGATNVTFANLKTAAESATERPLIVCYTGQTACYAVALLRLSGIDAVALKWGMSGWNSDFSASKWDTKIDSELAVTYSSNWNTDPAPGTVEYLDPELSETITDGAALLEARVDAVFADGFKTASGSDVIQNPGNYFINNYFSDAHFTGFGHIAGAYRIYDNFTFAGGDINKLDPSKDIVTYCYTGQTSAVITAYLRVLGYDAYSLTFGMNGLYHTSDFWDTGSDGGHVANHWGENASPKELSHTGTTK